MRIAEAQRRRWRAYAAEIGFLPKPRSAASAGRGKGPSATGAGSLSGGVKSGRSRSLCQAKPANLIVGKCS